MNHAEFISYVKLKTPKFLESLKDNNLNLFNFCLEGDLHQKIPLSSSVFASKILFMLNIFDEDIVKNLNNHILTFYNSDAKQIFDKNTLLFSKKK